MVDHLIANINSDEQNIIYEKAEHWALDYYRINVYNGGIEHPLQKFWFYVPKAKICDMNSDTNTLQLVLTSTNQDVQTINYIEKLEKNIFGHIKKKLSATIRIINKSFRKSDIFPPTIKLVYKEDTVFFDEFDDEITIPLSKESQNSLSPPPNFIKRNDMVGVYLELDYVLASEKEMWCSWKILQLKKLEAVDMRRSFFKLPTKHQNVLPTQPLFTSTIPPPPIFSIPPVPILQNVPNVFIPKIEIKKTKVESPPQSTQRSVSFSISEFDIKNQIGKLRKVSTEKKQDENIEGNVTPAYKIEELKKVETKLPMEIGEWYNASVENELICDLLNDNNIEVLMCGIEKMFNGTKERIRKIKNTSDVIEKMF